MSNSIYESSLQALANGDRATAFQLMRKYLMTNSRDASAWFWMSRMVDNEEQQRECLDRAIKIDPNHRDALNALEEIRLRALVAGFHAPVFEEKRIEPPKLGQALMAKKLISDAQLQEALREQLLDRNRGIRTMLGMILIKRKMISPLALAGVLVEQQQSRGSSDRLGDYLLLNKIITPERLQQAIAEHALACVYEKPIQLGELLVKHGYIRRDELNKALEEQRQDAYNRYYY
jgi:hypothetical protein